MASSWFDESYYLSAKAAYNNANAINGLTTWTSASVQASLNAAGLSAEQHYSQYGWTEGLAPNAYYVESQYVTSKVAALNAGAVGGKTDWTAADFYASLNGTNPFMHYVQYGAYETGVEPSTGFNDDTYYADKATYNNTNAVGGVTTWTADTVKAAFQSAGLTPIGHYELYGATEAFYTPTPAPVPGQTFTLTTGADYATDSVAFLNGTVPSAFRFTAASETVYGASTMFTTVDILKDSSTADQDVVNATFAAPGDATAASGVLMQNIENLNITLTPAAAAAGVMSLANVTGLDTITITGAATSLSITNYASSGVSTIDGSAVTSGALTINPTTVTTTNMTIKGGAGDDILGGSDGNDVISGGDGADNISGGAGDNTLTGGSGANTITASNGANTITGGTGIDTITVGGGDNIIVGGGGLDVIVTGSGDNTITVGDGGSNITTANGANTITGGSGVDTIAAGNGNNVIVTKGGADVIGVGIGNNSITGGTGADAITIAAGVGANVLYAVNGDSGVTSVTADNITGFITNSDQLSLGATSGTALNYTEVSADLGANDAAGVAAGKTAADIAFAGSGGSLQYYLAANTNLGATNSYLFVDYDLNGVADSSFILTAVTAADFASTDIIS